MATAAAVGGTAHDAFRTSPMQNDMWYGRNIHEKKR